jgi:hypothetical protein
MKYSKFLDLTAERQFRAWKKLGVRIAVRKTPVFYYVLYQVAGFYIEAKFLRGTDDLITFDSFTSIARLNPYLKQIDISDIFD